MQGHTLVDAEEAYVCMWIMIVDGMHTAAFYIIVVLLYDTSHSVIDSACYVYSTLQQLIAQAYKPAPPPPPPPRCILSISPLQSSGVTTMCVLIIGDHVAIYTIHRTLR